MMEGELGTAHLVWTIINLQPARVPVWFQQQVIQGSFQVLEIEGQ